MTIKDILNTPTLNFAENAVNFGNIFLEQRQHRHFDDSVFSVKIVNG